MFLPCVCHIYIYRYLQTQRGAVPFVICKVEYIPPVMAVYFRPLNKVSVGNILYTVFTVFRCHTLLTFIMLYFISQYTRIRVTTIYSYTSTPYRYARART